jgi:CheY-like chemotaxis protein
MPSMPSDDPPLVLLVDDYSDALDMYTEYFLFCGYRLVTAASGEEAVQLANSDPPSLILMDIRMQGIDGVRAMHLLRMNPALTDVPIVAFTAHALDHEVAGAILEGFDAVILKPCLPDVLVEKIQPFLTSRRVKN